MKKSDIGIIGLATMGETLALSIENKGYTVSVYNRRNKDRQEQRAERFMRLFGEHHQFSGFDNLEKFVESLERPRKVLIMVRAGIAVDYIIEQLISLLSPGDVIIDGGNSDFKDTERRMEYLDLKGILFVGAGISGRKESITKGFCIMPGGSPQGWSVVRPIFQSIAARASDGLPCCEWVGNGGAGHFVKMVYNSMEYVDMQLVAEGYCIMQQMLKANNEQIGCRFEEWNKGKLKSYLIESTSKILRQKDENGKYLVNQILELAGKQELGWQTVVNAMELGIPVTVITSTLLAWSMSEQKQVRASAIEHYKGDKPEFIHHPEIIVQEIQDALYSSKLIAYAQCFELLKEASLHYGWQLNVSLIARLWRGSNLNADLLNYIAEAFRADSKLTNFLLSPYFEEEIREALPGWKAMVIKAIRENIALPGISAALHYFFGLTTEQVTDNLIQAQQDYFKVERVKPMENPQYNLFETLEEKMDTEQGVYNTLAKTIESSIVN